MSARTGIPPTWSIVLIVEQNVNGVVIISSPLLIFKNKRDKWSDAVHELRANEYLIFLYFEKLFSNSKVFFHVTIHLDFKTSLHNLISCLT